MGSASAQSLNAFYEHALKNDLIYQHAYHQYLAELKNPKIVRSSAYPQLSGQASGFMSRQGKPTHDSHPGYSVQLNLKQLLPDGQLSAKIDQADWQAKLSQVQWASVQQSLMLRSATTYLQLLKNIEVYQSAKAQEKALKSLLTSVRHQYQLNKAYHFFFNISSKILMLTYLFEHLVQEFLYCLYYLFLEVILFLIYN